MASLATLLPGVNVPAWLTPKLYLRANEYVSSSDRPSLCAAYIERASQPSVVWKLIDFAIVFTLILTPIPGSTPLAYIYYRMHIAKGLHFEPIWQIATRPVLPIPACESDGTIDKDPVLLIRPTIDPTANLSSKEDIEGWKEKSQQFLVQNQQFEEEVIKPVPATQAVAMVSTFDAYREIQELDVHAHAMGEALNLTTRMPTKPAPNLKITGDFTEKPKNAKGNEVKMRSVNRLSTSNGLHYQSADKTQVLCTAATRYGVARKQFTIDDEGDKLARAISDNMFEEIIDVDKLATAWNDVAASSIYKGWCSKAKDSGYAAAHTIAAEDDDRILRFQGKGSFKAKEQDISLSATGKAPQGILAWSKGANSFFGYACRMISAVTRESLKDCATWNNGMTVDEAARRFTRACAKVPTAENVRLDAQEMDSKQNEFTHRIVRYFVERLCVSCEFLDLYFSMMEDYRVTNPDLKMFLSWVKASGEPFTLYGNSFLMTAMTLWLVRGEGPLAVFLQGDDVDLNRCNMWFDENRFANVALYCDFVMEMERGFYAAFCGYVLYEGLLVPNIRRKLIKLSGMSFLSQKHFEAVQINIRQWCKEIKEHLGLYDILAVNAGTYETTIANVEGWFEAIESLGHISAEQFAKATSRVELNTQFLSRGKNGQDYFLDTVY